MKTLTPLAILLTPTLITASSLTCTNGFTKHEIVIPASQINDGYCDCMDGSDELLTGACSGSLDWAGTGDVREGDDNGSQDEQRYKCSQQKLFLPLSHLDDGICDCCDGGDEPSGRCSDICDEILEEERKVKKKLADGFLIGNKKRQKEIMEFRQVVKDTMQEIDGLKGQIVPLETIIYEKGALVEEQKGNIVSEHLNTVNTIRDNFRANGDWKAFFHGEEGNPESMVEFIAAACHLYGESTMAHSKTSFSKETLCEPLRLAALDLGLLWNGENDMKIGAENDIVDAFMKNEMLLKESESEKEWVDPEDDILDDNRETESIDDDDHVSNTYYDDDYYDGVDLDGDDDEVVRRPRKQKKISKTYEKKYDDFIDDAGGDEYNYKFSSLMRSPFLAKSGKVLSRIDELLLNAAGEDDEGEDDESDSESTNDLENDLPPNFDPMAVQMVRNKLSTRVGQVKYGEILARSAKKMFESLEKIADEQQYIAYLENLVLGVINLSEIGEADVHEILAVINADIDNDSCYSPYSIICNSEDLRDVVSERCTERQNLNLCENADDDSHIPSNIQDGYFNYYVPTARGPDDYLSTIFATYHGNIFENTEVPSLDQDVKDATEKIAQLKKDIKVLKDERGMKAGKDGSPKFGKSGELYAIREDCFDINVAKYTYEVCLFGKSHQREGAATTGGTHLGTWEGASISEETGTRVWKWTGGAKCWNGPKRSATVFVTCGAETKLISADEPNICEYEFRMESYIGCDNKFKELHDL